MELWSVGPLPAPTQHSDVPFAQKQKGHSEISERPGEIRSRLGSGAENRVFGGLGDTELHDALCGNLNLFAGGRVAADAGLAVHQHEFSETGQGKGVLGVLVSQVSELFENGHGGLLRSEEHTSELQSRGHLVCRLLLEKKK